MSFQNEQINTAELNVNVKTSTAASPAQALTAYETALKKFVEYLDAGEFEKAQAINNQGQKTYPMRKPQFTFNFALQCMIQGQHHKSVIIFEQLICREYLNFDKSAKAEEAAAYQQNLSDSSELFRNVLYNWLYAKLQMINQLLEQSQKSSMLQGIRSSEAVVAGNNSQEDMYIRGEVQITNEKEREQPRVVVAEQSFGKRPKSSRGLDQETQEVVYLIQEATQLLQFHRLHRMSWTQDTDMINFQKMKFLMDQILKKILMEYKISHLAQLPKVTRAEELEIFKKIQLYEEENGGRDNSIDFKVFTVPNGLSSVLDASSGKDQDAVTIVGEQLSEKNFAMPTHQYNSQFAPQFLELQENQQNNLPFVPAHDAVHVEVKPDSKRSSMEPKVEHAAPTTLEQVVPRQIKYSKFKCCDLNKSLEKQGRASSLPESGGLSKTQVISFEDMHKFKDRYEITKNTVQQQTKLQKLVAQDSLNVTDLTPSQTSKGQLVTQENPAMEIVDENQRGSDLWVFQMNEQVDDFKCNFNVDDCQYVTKLERMDQLFGFFADEPNYQKQIEHEVIAFPIRNPLANIKDARRLAMEELVPDMSKAPPPQPQVYASEGQTTSLEPNIHKKSAEHARDDRNGKKDACNQEDDILQLSRVDKCLINMEELEMDVKGILMSLDNSKNRANQREYMTPEEKMFAKKPQFELEDPVKDQYMQLLKNMCNLAADPDIPDIILEAYKARQGKPEIVSTFQKERDLKSRNEYEKNQLQPSAAKDILIRTVLQPVKKKRFVKKLGNTDDDLKKFFKKRAIAIRQTLELELQNPTRNEQRHNYIDLAGEQIQKLLQVARKKKKERDRANQLSPTANDQMMNQQFYDSGDSGSGMPVVVSDGDSPQLSPTSPEVPALPIGGQESVQINLSMAFSKVGNIKTLFRKFGLENDKMLTNLMNSKRASASQISDGPFDKEDESADQEEKRIQAQLLSFQFRNDDRIEEFIMGTIPILDYLFAEHSALFLFQKSYCMTDLFEFCPRYFNKYVDELQEVLTTVPLKFSVLSSDKIDDNSWGQILSREFTYNRHDPCHHLLSKSLRYQSNLDALGREKFLWIEEILRRFNVLSIFNFAFREYLDTIISKSGFSLSASETMAEDVDDTNAVSRNQTSSMKSPSSTASPYKKGEFDPTEVLSLEELQAIQMHYEQKSLDNDRFDAKQVDQILLRKPSIYYLFADLCQTVRLDILQMACLETLPLGEYHVAKSHNAENGLQILNYGSQDVLLLLSGQLEIQVQQEGRFKNKSKKGDQKWATFQVLKEGAALPIILLQKLSYLYKRPVRVVAGGSQAHVQSQGFVPLSVQNSKNKAEREDASARLASAYSQVDSRPVTFFCFNQRQVGDAVFGPLKRSLYRKVESQAGLDFMYNCDVGGEQGMTEGEETSPFVMLVMAIVCQVKVSKYSETVVKKGEIPKALHLIVDGQADAVLEDLLPRSPRPSQFCRGVGSFEVPKLDKKPPTTNKSASTSTIDVRKFLKMERPEPPLAPFAFYIKERRELMQQRQVQQSAAATTRELVEEWKTMSDEEKNVYKDLAAEDRQRYDTEMQLFYCAQVNARDEAREFEKLERINAANRNMNQNDPNASKSNKAVLTMAKHDDQHACAMDEIKKKKLHDDHAVKGQLEFKTIKMCDYFSSRALIDDASVKNYIKGSKTQLAKWLRMPRKARVESVIRKFCLQMEIMNSVNGKLHSYSDLDSKIIVKSEAQIGLTGVLGELLDAEFLRKCQVNFSQKPVLERIQHTRAQFQFDDESQKVGNQEQQETPQEKQENVTSGVVSNQSMKPTIQASSEMPSEYKARLNEPSLSEYQWLAVRPRLLASQLSILVQSHELKCMLIKKQDKLFFGEQIKKVFDERMLLYEFKDVDRPMKTLGDMEEIRLDNRKWDFFKRQYEHVLLEKHYHKRKDLFTLKDNNNR